MTSEEFIEIINKECVDQSYQSHLEILAGDSAQATDPDWKKILAVYETLSAEQREGIHALVKVMGLNTTALVLAVLDGTCMIEGITAKNAFVLSQKNSRKPFNEGLVDLFWESHGD